jgi:hypothetical protein
LLQCECNRSAIWHATGLQLGKQLDATGCNQQLQLQPVATFSDVSNQGLASLRKQKHCGSDVR